MAFLDNSGDIILDAVLTDTGRRRLARGDGSFSIAKFALGDDEINYRIYDATNTSGSAYFDLQILQTPVLEAFTDPEAQLHNRLISLARNDILYLPVLKLFERAEKGSLRDTSTNSFLVAVDADTQDSVGTVTGVIWGEDVSSVTSATIIVDQGIDTNGSISAKTPLSEELFETQYQIEIDNRFGSIYTQAGTKGRVSIVDEAQMASYRLSLDVNSEYLSVIASSNASDSSINGPRGSRLAFRIGASLQLNDSTSLFSRFGGTSTVNGVSVYHIDSVVRATGVTTGRSIDIPVRFIKKV